MPLREGAAGTGLQVALETDGGGFVSELDSHVKLPRPACGGVRAATIVVVRDTRRHVGGETRVEVRRTTTVLENVDESFGTGHEASTGNSNAQTERVELLGNIRRMLRAS
jgi:hypothetical protein